MLGKFESELVKFMIGDEDSDLDYELCSDLVFVE